MKLFTRAIFDLYLDPQRKTEIVATAKQVARRNLLLHFEMLKSRA